MTWLEGHSLAQTVFTNLYLHQIDKIEDNVIRNFSLATLKVVDIVKDFIAKGNVFEEEDFQPLTYGFKLGSEVRFSTIFLSTRCTHEGSLLPNFQV